MLFWIFMILHDFLLDLVVILDIGIMKKLVFSILSFLFFTFSVFALGDSSYVSTKLTQGGFPLFESGKTAAVYISPEDFPGVIRALNDLKNDINKVTGITPEFYQNSTPQSKFIVIAGTVGKSELIKKLSDTKKIDISSIEGKWESFLIQTVDNPFPDIEKALVIAGSDKRGTIFGIYDLSQQIGVSPWYWWADVPVERKDALYILPGKYIQGSPSVKYRGIFLNDEYPNLTRWVAHTYGMAPLRENPPVPEDVSNYGHEFYEKLFELILRLKGNYLWPAMWNNAFNEDDPENPRLADEYGIVMGTTHQEPMLRAQKEWDRRYLSTLGRWNYVLHTDTLNKFWRDGISRNKHYESIITMGLRGANDTEMAPGGPEANMHLLEDIVDVQRKILAEEMNPDVTQIPQLWCLYKEVQDYYEAGMRVPDDVTLLWAEDNWGNVRRLPSAEERTRSGGAGVYYHFDYHGGPRSYQWINTSPIAKIWDQLSLAKQYGADKIWIVNVGHFKAYSFPTEYFMELAWNTEKWNNENINEFTALWAEREFGPEYAKDIAEIISKYTKFNGRRKPELLEPTTYSLIHYNEAEKVVEDYNAVASRAREIYDKLPAEKQDAFYQLVLFPAKACALVNELYLTAGKNMLYAKQGRASTNEMAEKTRELFREDTSLMGYFNRDFADGKWNHFMDQAHLGYVRWNDPPENSLQAIKLQEIDLQEKGKMGVTIEGSENVWPLTEKEPELPSFDVFNKQQRYIEICNQGMAPFEFTATPDKEWIKLSENKGKIEKDKRIFVSVQWDKIPFGSLSGVIKIKGTRSEVLVKYSVVNPTSITPKNLEGFVEANRYVSMEAEHFTKNTDFGDIRWIKIEDYGHTLSGMRATAPVDAASATPGWNSACLEYKMYLFNTGNIEVKTTLSPVLNFMADRGIQYAVSFDDYEPQIVTVVPRGYNAQNGNRDWEESVKNNARFGITKHTIDSPGYHTLKIWMVDPGVVLQKIVVDLGGVKPSYLGPPESFFNKK